MSILEELTGHRCQEAHSQLQSSIHPSVSHAKLVQFFEEHVDFVTIGTRQQTVQNGAVHGLMGDGFGVRACRVPKAGNKSHVDVDERAGFTVLDYENRTHIEQGHD